MRDERSDNKKAFKRMVGFCGLFPVFCRHCVGEFRIHYHGAKNK
jgi:hypothetical protein